METPFRFGLQRVRDLRAHDEDTAKEQFAASLSQRVRGEAMLRSVDAQFIAALAEAPVSPGLRPLSGADLHSRQAWIERLERSRTDAQVQLVGLEQQLEQHRAELTDASRRREVLDKLSDRQRDEHRRAEGVRQTTALDEMALQMHTRRSAAA
jgi:flagellar FliJ protein